MTASLSISAAKPLSCIRVSAFQAVHRRTAVESTPLPVCYKASIVLVSNVGNASLRFSGIAEPPVIASPRFHELLPYTCILAQVSSAQVSARFCRRSSNRLRIIDSSDDTALLGGDNSVNNWGFRRSTICRNYVPGG